MNLPEGWPTEAARNKFTNWIEDSAADCATVLDILENESTEQSCWISFWEGWKAALAAAPTPPAQEDEPDGYGAKIYGTDKWAYIWHEKDDVQGWINLQHQSQDNITYAGPIPLYTRPADDKLRKAAEELFDVIEELFGDFGHLDFQEKMENLRAALEGK